MPAITRSLLLVVLPGLLGLCCGCRGSGVTWGESERDRLLKERNLHVAGQDHFRQMALHNAGASWENDPLLERNVTAINPKVAAIDARLEELNRVGK